MHLSGTDSCDNVPDDGLCSDGDLCTGVETCDPDFDCQDGTDVVCDPGEVCDPSTGICGAECDSGDASLVAHWPFDEGSGTTASDSSGFGNDVTLKLGAGWTAGYTGLGGDFAVLAWDPHDSRQFISLIQTHDPHALRVTSDDAEFMDGDPLDFAPRGHHHQLVGITDADDADDLAVTSSGFDIA